MRFSASTVAAAAAFLSAGVVNAHMNMKFPYPYGPDTLNNSPLQNNLADFPCKQRPGVYDPPALPSPDANTLTIGVPATLEFLGDAVHGGGSCQISLTTDKEPTKDSVWKVIHSIEGGCPANTEGNLGSDPKGERASKFQFTIPPSIAPGEYTLAWTWINRIGNREYYMDCAPIRVQEAPKKRYTPTPPTEPRSLIPLAKRDDLPDMFIANINGCNTPEGIDIRYPNPGPSIEYAGNPMNLMKVGEPVCVYADGTPGPLAGGEEGGDGGNTEQPQPSNNAGPSPGVFAPLQSETVVPPVPTPPTPAPQPSTPTVQTQAPAPTVPSNPTPTVVPAPAPNSGNGGSALTGPCTEEGIYNCIGGTSFQRCASGEWTAVLPVAEGTVCKEGFSTDLGITHAKKRGIHRRRGHFRA
ncbi:hypothetical protein VTO42DRAFT_2232 [Malbranchea cinnamomea]